jgi:hypothetical protein
LENYLNNPASPNFEQIYHCAHELIFTSPPTDGSVDEFRPILNPFISNASGLTENAVRTLCDRIVKVIYKRFSASCDAPGASLAPLAAFLAKVRSEHVTRIYTTNYDDFVLQAVPDLYTGFDPRLSSEPKRFELERFWTQEDANSVFHLHGSVHLGFPHPIPHGGDIGELYWFDERSEALRHCEFHGSDESRMDGSSFLRTAVITGLEKLSRLQQRPIALLNG